jgi:nucleoid-associated protein YgaU
MSGSRLVVTTAAMGTVAAGLRVLTPDLAALAAGGFDPQHLVDTSGPEALLLAVVAAGAWLAWAWGALGLVLTALSALPGLAGAAADAVLRRVLPASGRRAAALALGVGLATVPALGACTTAVPAPSIVLAGDSQAVPDWPPRLPTAAPAAVPDWPAPATTQAPTSPAPTTQAPTSPVPASPAPAPPAAVPDWPAPAPGDHVVLRGECLWSIAEADLLARTGSVPTVAEVAVAVDRWWTANAAVIGDDPDLLLPGQVLRPPA